MAARPRRGVAGSGVALALVLVTLAGFAAFVVSAVPTARAAAAAELRTPRRPPDDVARAVRDVLRRPEYRREAPTRFERARTWVREQAGRLLATLFRGGRGTVLAWVVLGGLLTAVIVMSTRFARTIPPDPARAVTDRARPRRSAQEWRAEADALERAGDWKPALRARYRSLVADLGERGLLDEVPGRTAGEYRTAVASAVPRVASDFAGATELFERAWYGNRATGADEAERFRDLERRVLTETRA